jgi:LysM repeat protein
MPIIRLFFIVLLLIVPSISAAAQDQPTRPREIVNFLTNPAFEPPYADTGEVLSRAVAEGWTSWSLASEAEYPLFEAASQNSPDRILEGEDSQKFTAFLYEVFDAGVYQTVTGLEEGTDYTFTIKAYVWSTDDETERDVSAEPCGTTISIGIDPAGGVDPESETIVWSEPVEACDEYTGHAVTATAEGDTATAFVRAVANEPHVLTEVYLDDAVFRVAGADTDGIAATAEPDITEEVAATEEAALTAEVQAADTEQATPEDAGIITPSETEEQTPEVTVPTEEAPASTPEVLPTAEVVVPTETLAPPTDDVGATQTQDAALLGTNAALASTAQADLAAQTAVVGTSQAGIQQSATAIIASATAVVVQTEQAAQAVNAQATNDAIMAQATNLVLTVTQQANISALTSGAPTQTAVVVVVTATAEPVTEVPSTAGVAQDLPTSTPSVEPVVTEEAVEPAATEESVAERTIPLSEQFPGRILHTVRSGETVSYLSTLYGSTNEAIIAANGLNENALIYVGQGLIIPVRVPPLPTAAPTQVATHAPTGNIYIVQPGDTLSQIARRFNTTVTTLAQLNGIVNINSIQVGQRLQLPVDGGSPATPTAPTPVPPQETYFVQPGDSLYKIAVRYRVTVARLAEVNQISNPNRIFVGQRLVIPQS